MGARLLLLLAVCLRVTSASGSDKSEFYIEDGMVAKIFGETSNSTIDKAPDVSTLVPMIGMLRPYTFNVTNKYFSTNYKQLDSLPYFYLMIEGNIIRFKESQMLWNTSIGYGYIQKNILTYDSSGLFLADTVSLQWVPLELTSRYRVDHLFSDNVGASIDVGGGRLWLHQDGNIDGFDQGHAVSYVSLGSTVDLWVTDSVRILAQVAYLTDMQQNSDYRGWKLGVGAWLSI